jgi:hypothetical protein
MMDLKQMHTILTPSYHLGNSIVKVGLEIQSEMMIIRPATGFYTICWPNDNIYVRILLTLALVLIPHGLQQF